MGPKRNAKLFSKSHVRNWDDDCIHLSVIIANLPCHYHDTTNGEEYTKLPGFEY